MVFDELRVLRFGEIDITSQVVAFTGTWLTWIKRLRVLLIASDLFHELNPKPIKSNQSKIKCNSDLVLRKKDRLLSFECFEFCRTL